jgi:S1-C subfamily serine protease
MKKESHTNMHITYGIILVILVANIIIFGVYYNNKITQDYNSKISLLNVQISKLDEQLDKQVKEQELQQFQITNLESKLGESTAQYTSLIGELDQKVSDLVVESESFSEIISDKIDAVVSILTDNGQGSGAIISTEGYVMTNYHVIEGARSAVVKTYDGNSYSIKVIGYDKTNDLAILKIISNDTFDYLEFGNSEIVKAGQNVVALGNPAGLSFTATEGIISSPSRQADDGLYYIQTDTTLNPGNSGGPLINSQGEIIGIIDFKVSGYEELGFAIPSNRAENVYEKIISE